MNIVSHSNKENCANAWTVFQNNVDGDPEQTHVYRIYGALSKPHQ